MEFDDIVYSGDGDIVYSSGNSNNNDTYDDNDILKDILDDIVIDEDDILGGDLEYEMKENDQIIPEMDITKINQEIDINNVVLTKSLPGYKPTISTDKCNNSDLYDVFDNYNQLNGVVAHHIKSANNFYTNGIDSIIKKGFIIKKEIIPEHKIDEDGNHINKIIVSVIFKNVRIQSPIRHIYKTNKIEPLYPTDASILEKNYSGSVYINAEITITVEFTNNTTKVITKEVSDFKICTLPIIIGSILCNTYQQSKASLEQLGEDPSNPGGYLQLKNAYSINLTENMVFNIPKIYKNEGHGKSRVRCEYLSKPGDLYQNSDYFIIIYNVDNTLTIQIQRDKLMNIEIPFYLVFRALGWSTDKELYEHIVMDAEDESNKKILNQLNECFAAKYDTKNDVNSLNLHNQNDAILHIVNLIPDDKFKKLKLQVNSENEVYAISYIKSIFDNHCLPHVGMRFENRIEKLKVLAQCIRKMFMVFAEIILPTDRDSYVFRRITAAGENYAKSFKTYFNQTVILPAGRRFIQAFKANLYPKIDIVHTFKTSINPTKLDELISKTVTNANKAELKISNTQKVVNRLSAQIITPKNQLYVVSLLRQIVSTNSDSAKQSERAAEMRRIHMSSLGYVCVIHSPPEGKSVGINKQLAMFATIAPASSSEVLKKILTEDMEILINNSQNIIKPKEIYMRNYACVYVNGYLVGYVESAINFVKKYRNKRRHLEINFHTTIYWDSIQNEVYFYVDVGRLTRPLIIIYNNERDYDEITKVKDTQLNKSHKFGDFIQGSAITKQDIIDLRQRKKTYEHLIIERKIEFITPEEQQNCLICPDTQTLEAAKHNKLFQYTHLEIPQCMVGITGLTPPFGSHNNTSKNTYQTAQARQTCGIYALNWGRLFHKETFLQYVNETPLVKTNANRYVFPNGCNIMVAMMMYTGFNQEDSVIINQGAIDRGMFNGCKSTYIKTEFAQKEELRTPDITKTEGIKTKYDYSKLKNGIVEVGTIITSGTIVIGKCVLNSKESAMQYTDASVVYKDYELAYVHAVVRDRNEDDLEFVKISLLKLRPIICGDKMSSRAGLAYLAGKSLIKSKASMKLCYRNMI